jgi:hypothetical protein
MDESKLDTLAERLDYLIRENGRLKLAGLVVLLMVVAFTFMGQAQPSNLTRVVEAEKFFLRDANGKSRAGLFTTPDGSPTLTLNDKEGEPRMLMTVGQDGTPVIALQDKNDILRAVLTVEAGGASLSFHDKDGGQRSKLYLDKSGSPALGFWGKSVLDKGVRPRVLLVLSPDGSPRLSLTSKDGKPRIGLGAVADEHSLAFFDGKGEPRVGIAVDPDGTPHMNIFDRNGKPVWKAP